MYEYLLKHGHIVSLWNVSHFARRRRRRRIFCPNVTKAAVINPSFIHDDITLS